MHLTELTNDCHPVGHSLCAESTGNQQPLATPAAAPSPTNGTAKPSTRKRGGAPSGNSNAAKHGLKGSKLPPGAVREERAIQALVRAAQAACEAKHGSPVTVHQLAVLHRLRRWATKDRLAARWLRLEAATMAIEQRLALTDAMAAAATEIEKCMRQLGIDGPADAANDLERAFAAARQPRPVAPAPPAPIATKAE